MPIDTRGLRQEHIGKRLRVELAGGVVDLVELLELTICEPPEPCCGFTYRLLARERGDARKPEGEVYWTAFGEIENFRVLGD